MPEVAPKPLTEKEFDLLMDRILPKRYPGRECFFCGRVFETGYELVTHECQPK